MYPNHNQYGPSGPRSPTDDIKGGFASVAAAMVSLILSPPLNEVTSPYVYRLATRTYAPELVDLIMIAWLILCWPLCYFAARASIIAALTAAGVYLAYRFI